MYVILGGAYNGKRQYVAERFPTVRFIEGDFLQQAVSAPIIAIGRFEEAVAGLLHLQEEAIVAHILDKIDHYAQASTVICICTDVTRGVVPLDAASRKTRDCLGRLYQQLCARADEVTRVWYGLPQCLKEKKT